jgi:hypothetical protein
MDSLSNLILLVIQGVFSGIYGNYPTNYYLMSEICLRQREIPVIIIAHDDNIIL